MGDEALALGLEGLVEVGGDLIEGFGWGGGFLLLGWLGRSRGGGLSRCGVRVRRAVCGCWAEGLEESGGCCGGGSS